MLVARAEYNYYPGYTVEENQKKVVKKKKRVRAVNKSMYIAIALIIFATSLFILYRYAKITEANLEITRLEKEVEELQKIKLNLEGELESLKSTTTISEVAKNNLGMIFPEDGQVVYISVNDNAEVEFAGKSFSEKLKKLFSNFSSLF